mmetsp:Transcript_19255/g.21483  ORF Transcript_19255/g.21483 Transcript_19255/m.21483 type:complete len:403 (+) Transcript_19255:71-1279(+)
MLNDEEDWDKYKVFISRVPTNFDESSIKRLIEDGLEEENCVIKVSLVLSNEENDKAQKSDDEKLSSSEENNDDSRQRQSTITNKNSNAKQEHRGFAFVVLKDAILQKKALDLGKIRGGRKTNSKKKHTMYIRPIIRDEDEQPKKNVCHLWINFRCPYGDACKFTHEGEGGCVQKSDTKKKQKCFAFKKGKCKKGDECPYSHDFDVPKEEKCIEVPQRPNNEKDCINWKTKGKCRKGDKCPYRHDEALRQAFLKKNEKKKRKLDSTNDEEENKTRQPLSIRIFGLNYDTTEDDVKEFLKHCGTIVEVTFPKFEDSGRSKGYCGVLFQSPKAVAKAAELDGEELHGRWLRIQAGKMYLKQWEDHHKDPHHFHQPANETSNENDEPLIGEFGQKVKRRKKHGYDA